MGELTIRWPDEGAAAVVSASERLAAARRRLIEMPHGRIVESIGAAFDAFADPRSPARQALCSRLPQATGTTPETISVGLERALVHWRAEAVRALVDLELTPQLEAGRVLAPHPQTSVLLAGSIPMPTITSCLFPLLVRSPVLVKTASRDRVTAHVVAETLRIIDPELGACIEVVDFEGSDAPTLDQFLDAPCVVASGSDETLADVVGRLSGRPHWVGHGHRFSLAVLGADACRGDRMRESARALALDVALWDQAGCLSPAWVHVVGGGPDEVARFGECLATELAELSVSMPRARIDAASGAVIRSERDEAEMRAAGGQDVQVHASGDSAWTVVVEESPELRRAPMNRFVRIHPADTLDTWASVIAQHSQHLSTVGVAGSGVESTRARAVFTAAGASRIAPIGRMQAPPLDWPHDGQPALMNLCRWAAVEVS